MTIDRVRVEQFTIRLLRETNNFVKGQGSVEEAVVVLRELLKIYVQRAREEAISDTIVHLKGKKP